MAKKTGAHDPVNLLVCLIGNEIRLTVPTSEAELLIAAVERGQNGLVTIVGEKGAKTLIRPANIQAIELRPPGVRSVSKRLGVTIKEIAAITGQAYVTLVRKVNKPGGIRLDVASDRRVLCSDENFDRLNLSKEHRAKLRQIESKRAGST